MAYLLTCIETNEVIVVDDHVWREALRVAEENGWEPAGTMYDIATVLDDWCNEEWENTTSPINSILIIIQHVSLNNDWDGNYTDRENQIISEADANYLAYYIDGNGFDDALIEFLNSGSIRINAL